MDDHALMGEWLKLAGWNLLNGFDNVSDVTRSFQVEDKDVRGHIIAAIYNVDGYEGQAFVLMVEDGVLYEVNGSHCSCYGLEGMWGPEITSVAALRKRQWSSYGTDVEREMARLFDLLEALS